MIPLNQLVVAILQHVSTLFSKVLNILPESVIVFASTFSRQAKLKVISDELEKFDGGSVDLEVEEDTGIAVMTLNNPSKLNSMTGKMIVDMASKITILENWSRGKALILVGKGGSFCSGANLTFVKKARHFASEMAMFQHDTLTRLFNLPLISVALMQGHTLGGGAELSTACDFRVMSSSAKLGFVQMKMGVTPVWGATTRLVQLIGRQKTLDVLMRAKVLCAEEAAKYCLVDHVLQPAISSEEEFLECRKWLLSNYCQHDIDLTQNLKSSIVFCDANRDLETSLGEERRIIAKFWGGPVHTSALAANIKHR